MSKKLLSVGVALALVATVLVGVGAQTASADAAQCSLVTTLINAGLIPADKVATAKAAAGCDAVSPAYTFTRDLTVGSTGADVTALQNKLGVAPATGYFGAITKAAVVAYQTANGIVPASGYVGPITRAKLNYVAPVVVPATPATPSTSLEGGAGDLNLDDTNTGVKNSLKEGEENVKVLGVTAEADGSDIAVTSVKVTLNNASTTDGSSEKLSNYLDEVSVYLGSKKVGSADVSDFSKDSGTPDSFSKTISLKDAVIKDGDDQKLYVAVSANSDIDSEDIVADWKLNVETVRFTDGTGAILTASDDVAEQSFGFDSSSSETGFTMKSSSSNPDEDVITVEDNEDSITDDVLALVLKIDVDDDSEDISITSIPVVLTVSTSTTAGTADSIEDIIDTVTVEIAGESYEADLSTSTIANNAGTATYIVDIDAGDVVLSGGDVEDLKVYLSFKGIEDSNYAEDTIVVATIAEDSIEAETEDDELTSTQKSGTDKDGPELTLSTSAVSVSGMSWNIPAGGAFIEFVFTVKAETDDFLVASSSIMDTVSGTATTSVPVLSRSSGDSVTGDSNVGFTVAEGDTTTFKVRYTLTGTNGTWSEVIMTNIVGKVVPDDKQVSGPVTITFN